LVEKNSRQYSTAGQLVSYVSILLALEVMDCDRPKCGGCRSPKHPILSQLPTSSNQMVDRVSAGFSWFQLVSAGFSWFQHMKDITDITNIIAAANAAIDQRSQRSQSSRWILWLLAVASYGCFGLLTAETEADLQAQMGKQLSDGYNLLNAESV